MDVLVSMIVAMADNRCIGKGNALPWRISEDLKFFKSVTMGKPVIMGRKTFQSIGKALPGRANIVITRNPEPFEDDETIEPVESIDLALRAGRMVASITGTEEVVVIGGSQIYEACLGEATRIYLTEVHTTIDGDAFFPELGPEWKEVERSERLHDEKSGLDFTFVTLERER